ncbi:ATP-grasp fold amidoligase family protein [Aeromicrobium sp.]
MTSKPLAWARNRARSLPHVAWRDERIAELVAARAKLNRELAKARKELANLDPADVEVPSFRRYVFAERRIHSHMKHRNYPDRGNLVTRKLKSYSFAQSHGVTIPELFGIWDRPEDIGWDELPDEVVIKSHTGTYGRGVFPLRRVGGNWSMVTTKGVIKPAEIVERLRGFEARRLVGGPYFAEELLGGGVGDVIPPDVKFLAFHGEIGLGYLRALETFDDSSSWRYRPFLEDGSNPGPIYRGHTYDPTVPIPDNLDELVAAAKRLSLGIPRAFTRIDMYSVSGRVVFGELTPRPGGPVDFGAEHDERLGHLWERAHARVLNDAIDGADQLLRFGPGPRELKIGDALVLPPQDSRPDQA